MINVVLPIAGYAKRFIDHGYKLPKPLLPVDGVPMIKLAVSSLLPNPDDYKLIFVIREDHDVDHDIRNVLKHYFKGTVEFVVLNQVTQGTLCSCLTARHLIDPGEPLIIYTPDVYFEGDFDIRRDFVDTEYNGLLVTFKANSRDHSYVAYDEKTRLATETAEKRVISSDASVGVYCYRDGTTFLKYADKAIGANIKTNNEFYVAPMYNLMIQDGHKVGIHRIDKMHVLGTPEDLNFYECFVAKYKPINKIAVCADHSGFKLKEDIKLQLDSMGVECVDFGAHSANDSDQYDFLKPCIEYLAANQHTLGIGCCQTGQGMNIAANKAKNIRSVLIHDARAVEMGRRHNAANFFALSTSDINPDQLPAIIEAMLTHTFDGGRHATRIKKFNQDQAIFNP